VKIGHALAKLAPGTEVRPHRVLQAIMRLPTRRLGKSDMDITRVGFGTRAGGSGGWAFSWGTQDDNESVAAICLDGEAGANWAGTAAVHGLGHSEEVVGRALSGLAPEDPPYVFTKCRPVWDETDAHRPARRVGRPDSARLTGAFSAERAAKLDKEDWCSRHAEFQGERLERKLALAEAFCLIADRYEVTPAAAAWVPPRPSCTGAIVDARSPSQVDGWIRAA